MINPDVAMDIETTGLSPWDSRVVTVAIASNFGDKVDVFDNPGDERDVLKSVDRHLMRVPTERGNIVTWNGSEFDLPFIAVRMVLNGLRVGFVLDAIGQAGKYGKPRYETSWYGFELYDVAYDYEAWCRENDVRWSLKPTAEAAHAGKGIEIDFETRTILDLTADERALYCSSDAQLALALYLRRPPQQQQARGQAVGLDGSVSILTGGDADV